MGNKASLYIKAISSLSVLLSIGLLFFSACATTTTQQAVTEEPETSIIESLSVKPSAGGTVVEIVNTKPTPYTAFKLINPPRVIVDIPGEVGSGLQKTTKPNDENVREIRLEPGADQTLTTRMVVSLARDVDYEIADQGPIITLTLMPREPSRVAEVSKIKEVPESSQSDTAEPRIFFDPDDANSLNQILGVDYMMLDGGRSLLVVTTDKKATYEMQRIGPKTLELTLEESTIPPLLMRRLDSQFFEGAVDRVKASMMDSQVILNISLRDMVPFHVKQTVAGISVDFEATPVKPPVKSLTPMQTAEKTQVRAALDSPRETSITDVQIPLSSEQALETTGTSTLTSGTTPQSAPKVYTGTPMSFDFVDGEVTNILRMMNEMTDLNIISDPDISGERINLSVNEVPWDQVLDIILLTNNLAKRQIAPNIIMITTAAKMSQIEAEENRKEQEQIAKIDAERRRIIEEREKEKELAPLITEYIPMDFAMVEDIKPHIVVSDRGSISTDARTNTIIIKDIAESIEEAKEVVKQFDTPVKQIMIEARLVDAETNFGREVGVEWTSTRLWQKDDGTNWEFDPKGYDSNSDLVLGGTVSSNAPQGWASNIGFSLARLTNQGLGTFSLDAYLAYAETEGTAKVISAPKVIASNGESATIARGTTFYLDAAENVEHKEVKAELSLEVTSTVSYNNFVTMEVTVKDETAGESRKSGKDLTTKLMVASGETIVIGGIYKEDRSEETSGIPVLKDIPVVGWAFKARSNVVSKSELLIFITPTVLPPPGRAQGRPEI
ncbi:MAG: type IV pilus secretin PilQ [Deltaproteobacteria bacterium]|nr:type IV pilus secretin PilQ [Deltaproteobacteria bacterium]